MRISDWSSDVCSSDLQGRRCHHPHPGTHDRQQMNVGACHPAVRDVAADRHLEPLEMTLAAADGEGIEQCLGRMLVAAVAGVDHRAVDLLGQQVDGAGRSAEHTSELPSLMRISY